VIAARDLSQEDKDTYLRLIYEGLNPAQAAHELGSTGTQFRSLRNPLGEHYDEAFARAYTAAITSEAHELARLEHLRDLVWARAEAGDSRMLEKLALVYDPDWATLRHQNLNVNVQMVARMLPHISTAELERALAELEAEKDDDVLEGVVRELPAA
jgi:hypothetical protein